MKFLLRLKNPRSHGTINYQKVNSGHVCNVRISWEMWKVSVFSPHPGKSPEKAIATHSSTLAWKIPWAEEPGRLQSMGSHRVGHDWSDLAAAAAAMHNNYLYLVTPTDTISFSSQMSFPLWDLSPTQLIAFLDLIPFLHFFPRAYHRSLTSAVMFCCCCC